MAREFVGCREEKTLQARRSRHQIPYQRGIARRGQEIIPAGEALALHQIGNVKHGEAFWYGQLADVNASVGDRVKDFAARSGMVEKILAGLQRAPRAPAGQRFKHPAAAHDALIGKQARNSAPRSTMRNIDEDSLRREVLIGKIERGAHPPRQDQGRQEQNCKGSPHGCHLSRPARGTPARGTQVIAQNHRRRHLIKPVLFAVTRSSLSASDLRKHLLRFPAAQPFVCQFNWNAQFRAKAFGKAARFGGHFALSAGEL